MNKKNKKDRKTSKPVLTPVAKPVTATLNDVRQAAQPVGIPADVSTLPLTAEDADKIRAAEQKVAAAKIQLADLEIQAADQLSKKNEVLKLLRDTSQEMIGQVNQIATSYGIDVNSQNGRKWNLNTAEMIFREVK